MPSFKRSYPLGWTAAIVALAGTLTFSTCSAGDPLLRAFKDPPASARPRVWWHWMNGNITKDGIKADLEWMNRVGIGGFQNFDANFMTPQIVEKRLVFMTPEWKDAFKFAANLANDLGLEMAIAGSPGWSESGGPWVTPFEGMKKYVWSETRVEGGKPFAGVLPRPSDTAGPMQDAPFVGGISGLMGTPQKPPGLYVDAAVVAFRTPDDDIPMAELKPKVTASGGRIDASLLSDGSLFRTVSLPMAPPGKQSWVQLDFGKPQAIRAVTLAVRDTNPLSALLGAGTESGPDLLASDDGQRFRPVMTMPKAATPQVTVSLPAVRARYYRLAFTTPQPQGLPSELGGVDLSMFGGTASLPKPATAYEVAELVLHPGARVNRFEDKAAFSTATSLAALATPAVAASGTISKDDAIDLTAKMSADGTLDWTPPPGPWTILRFGYSPLGISNHPASPEGTGLEVDKLSPSAVRAYFDAYLDQYKDATGGLMGNKGLGYVITDSWEAGAENWTDEMIAEFAKRRRYDMTPWLPVLAGRVVGSAEASDRFLWDFRRTIADLTAEYHYDQLTDILKERGMARYSESHENGRALIADGMAVKRTAAVPMSAIWTGRGGPNGVPVGASADIRESASVAHIYGQNIAAAESLTAASNAFGFSPEMLKPLADAALSQGLNRFVIHTSVHQPLSDKRPGLSLGPFGQWFTRLETWAEQAKPWMTYLARGSYMLQQGTFVADVIHYYGEDSNITALFGNEGPDVPAGCNFDYANSDVVENRLAVTDGRLTTTTGMRYAVLSIDANAVRMPLAVLRRIRDLVNAGAAVVGPKPIESPSLSDDQAEFKSIADALWGGGGGERAVGKGRVFAGMKIAEALSALNLVPDFEYSKPEADSAVLFVHRTLADGDIYWINNRKNRTEEIDATFRVTGKAPELWHPDTGEIEPAAYRVANGRTVVSIRMDPNDAVFVVFRKASSAASRTLPHITETTLGTIEGSWEVSFQPNRGAPANITLEKLSSWHEHAEAGVKYFSGTATYTKTIQAPPGWFGSGAEIWLDLGSVKNLAELTVNGKSSGILWKPPFRANVSAALKPGANALEVKVTNLWVNRLIGDRQPGAAQYTFTAMRFYRADSPLVPSGLLGPITVLRRAPSNP